MATAQLVELTDGLVDRAVQEAWWSDPLIDTAAADGEIDRHWDWHVNEAEVDGDLVGIVRLAVVTGDGAVQGAMLISATAVPMTAPANRDETGLLVEWLFTAPRNRPEVIRSASQPIFYGIGLSLIRAAVQFSRDLGCAGRLRLDASPRALRWYENRGFVAVPAGRTLYQDVSYDAMELSSSAAGRLLPP